MLRALRGALDAVQDRDCEVADAVIAFDDDIDRRYLSIAQRIESLLARQTPVAGDLRLVLAVLHTNLHLERMADYCVSIAELSKRAARATRRDDLLLEALSECGERVEIMIKVALDSLARRDLPGAESLVELDELIDDTNRRFVERVTLVARRLRPARVGPADGVRRALARAHRRPRRGRRRAGGLPADGRVPRVHGCEPPPPDDGPPPRHRPDGETNTRLCASPECHQVLPGRSPTRCTRAGSVRPMNMRIMACSRRTAAAGVASISLSLATVAALGTDRRCSPAPGRAARRSGEHARCSDHVVLG